MRIRPLAHAARFVLAATFAISLGACGSSASKPPASPIEMLRAGSAQTQDSEALGRWLLGELLVPGGETARAQKARETLEKAPNNKGLFASIARGFDNDSRGHFRAAALAYIEAIDAARTSDHPDAPMVAWFAAHHLLRLRSSVTNLWDVARPSVLKSVDQPGNIGWRARGVLAEWWAADGLRKEPPVTGKDTPDVMAERFGCVAKARLAGPFGHFGPMDHLKHFDAEKPGPWSRVFAADPRRTVRPRVLASDRDGCHWSPSEPTEGGIFYIETFLDLPAERDVLIAVQAVLSVFVDDVEVLHRDPKQWGVWPRFGAHLRLSKGRHRILARVGTSNTAIRILQPNGLPIGIETSDDPAPPYVLTPPTVLSDPNVLEPFIQALGVKPAPYAVRPATPRDTNDPISRFLAAWLAHVESQDDIASVLLEPLVKDPGRATGSALATQAVFVEKDPIFPPNDAQDLVKDMRGRAAVKDPELWWPRLWLAFDEAQKLGPSEAATKIAQLADQFREVPEILKALGQLYARIGWNVEHARTVRETATRFPDDVEALRALVNLYDERGDVAEADKVSAQITKLDPDAEIALERALERHDFGGAIRELETIGRTRKDRKDIAGRISYLLTRAGAQRESMESLERAVRKDPTNPSARMALADSRMARGDRGALRAALVEAIQSGTETDALRDAIELVEGTTELTPYRIDGKKVIADFEASGETLPGTAARVLDYSALWVHGDGTARMLEHEIIGIQSREGIEEHAEQRLPRGLILRLRTIKKDGRILEPEFVEGKPTVTMPHLEEGDYIETETLYGLRGDGQGGRTFEGPRWFFREEKIPYFRSEFVVVSPKNRPLDVEAAGAGVPQPIVTENGAFITRRFRVDKSPALPEEPSSAPLQEFLPNVRVGWGINLEDIIARAVDAATDETPNDPRLKRIADSIVTGSAPDAENTAKRPSSIDEQARRIYRWVLANVEQGREEDGRRIVLGKSGNRTEAFLYLCRLSGIDASMGMVRDRLTAPSHGPFSEAESYNALAVRIVTEHGPRWMVVRDKFAAYGYLPSSLRGQPAVVFQAGGPRETTPTTGSADGVTYDGTVELRKDGSAVLDLEQRYEGKFAILLRTALESLPDAQREEAIETRLVGQALPGARLRKLDVKNLSDLDAPLVLAMNLEMNDFARVNGNEIVIAPPFTVRLGALASLPSRETPLYISEQSAMFSTVHLRIKLPDGAHVTSNLVASTSNDGTHSSQVKDRVEQDVLVFDRVVGIPAGRIQPEAYAAFQGFVREAETALRKDIVISLGQR
jgi:thioredoxin-like negative regulator of GroEL